MCNEHQSNRRQFLLKATASVISILTPFTTANAQSYNLMCSWSGGSSSGSGLAKASPQATNELNIIMESLGFLAPIEIYIGGVDNAAATVIQGTPVVIYNPQFLGQLYQCNQVAAATVLAHEVGHHANRDTSWAGQFNNPWDKELGADFVSGIAMRRLSVSLDNALSGIYCSFGSFSPGSASHPDSQLRLEAVAEGWHAG